MHSSRMRTARFLPVSPSMHCSRGGGEPGPGSVPARGCTWSQGVYLLRVSVPAGGCTWSWGVYLVLGCTYWGVYLLEVYLLGGCTCLGGVPGPEGCIWSRGMYLVLEGMYLPGQGTCPGTPPLWTEFLTHASENITLPQTSFVGGKYVNIGKF